MQKKLLILFLRLIIGKEERLSDQYKIQIKLFNETKNSMRAKPVMDTSTNFFVI
ncbi:MAG: hypothetical protein OK457_08015 [Thaumarchaeota archaeon]|nr:hypothetical protein [Nitrososphaerota archaeon]